jgi:hypothetical protein
MLRDPPRLDTVRERCAAFLSSSRVTMYAFTWTGVRGNIVRELEKPCQMHGGVGPRT